MASNSLYDIIKNFEELGSQFSPVPFDYSVEFRNKYLKVSDELLKFTEFQRTLVPDMPWLSTSQIMVGTSLSSEYATPDSVDGMDEDHGSTKIIEEDSLSSEDSVIQRASKDSTNSTDINQINRAFFLSLSKRTQTFVWLLEHTDFEDGIENDVTKEVHGYIKKNEFVTYAWLNSIFANYLSRPGVRQPIFTSYCDGNRVSCQGLSQWGSKYLGDQGYSAIEIIRYYYGNDMYINAAQAISGVPSSWPGYDLTIGASGPKVRQIQEQLNRIAQNYPAIPKTSADGIFGSQTAAQVRAFQRIFNLPATGIVDYPTWYQISNIYVAVSRIAEPGT